MDIHYIQSHPRKEKQRKRWMDGWGEEKGKKGMNIPTDIYFTIPTFQSSRYHIKIYLLERNPVSGGISQVYTEWTHSITLPPLPYISNMVRTYGIRIQ